MKFHLKFFFHLIVKNIKPAFQSTSTHYVIKTSLCYFKAFRLLLTKKKSAFFFVWLYFSFSFRPGRSGSSYFRYLSIKSNLLEVMREWIFVYFVLFIIDQLKRKKRNRATITITVAENIMKSIETFYMIHRLRKKSQMLENYL